MAHIFTNEDGTVELHDVWCYEDIQNVQDCRDGEHLTDEQCKKVIEQLASWYDANEGINWLTVEYAIDEVLEAKHETQNL